MGCNKKGCYIESMLGTNLMLNKKMPISRMLWKSLMSNRESRLGMAPMMNGIFINHLSNLNVEWKNAHRWDDGNIPNVE